jgi:hypothetical protein
VLLSLQSVTKVQKLCRKVSLDAVDKMRKRSNLCTLRAFSYAKKFMLQVKMRKCQWTSQLLARQQQQQIAVFEKRNFTTDRCATANPHLKPEYC